MLCRIFCIRRTGIPIRVTYEATLVPRRLSRVAPGDDVPPVEPLPGADRKRYLTEHGDIDFSEEGFGKWLREAKLRREKGEGDVAFARRVFMSIHSSTTYEFRRDIDRRASAVCVSKKSDCGGLANLFVAVMRANEIPARTLFGRWAISAEKDGTLNGQPFYQWHVKSEFHAEGVGWVPVEIAGAVVTKGKRQPEEFFGRDAGRFLTFHIDPNVSMDTEVFGVRSSVTLQTPAWWVSGQGRATPNETREGWVVTELD